MYRLFKTEFVQLVVTQATDICENEAKNTMTPVHVLAALKELGYEDYLETVSEELGKFKDSVRTLKIATQIIKIIVLHLHFAFTDASALYFRQIKSTS